MLLRAKRDALELAVLCGVVTAGEAVTVVGYATPAILGVPRD